MARWLIPFFVFVASASATSSDTVRVTYLSAKPEITRTLTDHDAANIKQAFEGLSWDHTVGDKCHQPSFKIEITSPDSKLQATICFACRNVQFIVPSERGLQGFNASDAAAKHLLDLLTRLFPRANPT